VESPLFVQVIPIPKSAQEQAQEAKERDEKRSADRWLVRWTAALVAATLGLILATGVLGYFGYRQSKDMRESIAVAKRSADFAERALTDLERPWIFIFGAKVGTRDSETDEWFIEYSVANYGKMPAIIEQASIGIELSDKGEPPMPLNAASDHSLVVSPILAAGERRILREYFPLQDNDVTFRVTEDRKGEPILHAVPHYSSPEGFDSFFRVVIRYRGPQSTGHETGANWLYQPSFDFVVGGGTKYNFSC
jgi:hypothetical protein